MTQQVVKIKSIKPVTHDVLQIITEKPRQLDFTAGQAVEISINIEGWKNEKRKIVNPKEFNLRMESPKRLQPSKGNLQTIISIVFGSLLPKALLTPD